LDYKDLYLFDDPKDVIEPEEISIEDDERYDEVSNMIDSVIERSAEQHAAEAWSTPGDTLLENLAAAAQWDENDVFLIATFGDNGYAVNGDALVSQELADRLQLPRRARPVPYLWSEIGNEIGTNLELWLESNGYELIPMGGGIPTTEEEIDLEGVVEVVYANTGYPKDFIDAVLAKKCEKRDLSCRNGLTYISVSGETEVWAKRIRVSPSTTVHVHFPGVQSGTRRHWVLDVWQGERDEFLHTNVTQRIELNSAAPGLALYTVWQLLPRQIQDAFPVGVWRVDDEGDGWWAGP